MASFDSDAFEQQVRDCLLHLYDYVFLQEHPLVRACVPEAKGDASRVQRFREVITKTIESLKFGAGIGDPSRSARTYNILQLRYVHQRPVQHILNHLNLSERQFYRDHNKAVQALSGALSEQLRTPVTALPTSMSIQSELERVYHQDDSQQINALGFAQKTAATIQGLLDRHQTEVVLNVPDLSLALHTNPMILRQTMIWIFSQLVAQSPHPCRITLSLELVPPHCRFILSREDRVSESAPLYFSAEQSDTLSTLVTALGGKITQEVRSRETIQIVLEIPLRQHTILVVDDNPDAVMLFRHYLVNQPYQVITSCDSTQTLELASQAQPVLIILDVMLPKQDGWEILQLLKNQQSTRHIPVLICSVLNAGNIALSVGADGFLKKPPSEAEVMDVLERLVIIRK